MATTKIQLLEGKQLFKVIKTGTISAMFDLRLGKLRENLKKAKLQAILVSDVSNITYLTGYDNFSSYEREAYLLIGRDFQYLITDARYSEAVKKEVPHFSIFERSQQNPVEKLFQDLKKQIKILAIEENDLTVLEHKFLTKHFKKTKHLSVSQLRSIKQDFEIKKIAKACNLGDLAFKHILKKIKLGISEKEVANYLEKFIREKGAGVSFPPIVAFGGNCSIPHHQTGDEKINRGDFVLLDFGVKLENYCSDMTRTIFFGKPSDKQRKIYKIVLEAQKRSVNFINNSLKNGKEIKAADVDKVARRYIKGQSFPDIPHSLGHGIGLEVHEHPSLSPKSREVLKEGMIFSIEPGIYLPGFGGIRIEDLFIFEKTSLRQLTASSKEIIIVE